MRKISNEELLEKLPSPKSILGGKVNSNEIDSSYLYEIWIENFTFSSGINLSSYYMEKSKFVNCIFLSKNISQTSFSNSTFKNCVFQKNDFHKKMMHEINFSYCVFCDCNFSRVHLSGNVSNCVFDS